MKRYLLKRYIKEAAISWLQPLAGFVTADAHDAAFAIYTSGTTGNPKGVLHEYGNLERAIESISLNGEIYLSCKL